MKERIKKKINYVVFMLETFLLVGLTTLTAYADDDYGDLNWLTTDSNNTFSGATNAAKGIFSSAYGLVMVISGGVLVLCTIMAGITFAYGGRSGKEDAQQKILGVFIGGMVVFGAVSIISGIAGIATGAFSS